MKKTILVLALAVVMVFAVTSIALADHSPGFYIKWSEAGGYEGANAGSSPHAGYTEGTAKCAVCHATHRAPVGGTEYRAGLATDATHPVAANPPAFGGGYAANGGERQAFEVTDGVATEMLLANTVKDSCAYCHILTSVGGEQIYAGGLKYAQNAEAPPAGIGASEWDVGFAHHNGCTGCHAVHGASSNYGNVPEFYGDYGTFKGALAPKVLKVRAKGSGGAPGDPKQYVWQDEVVRFGTDGLAEAGTAAEFSGWDLTGVVATSAVDTLNIPLFPSEADAVNGDNVRPGVDTADAQVSAFCTFCHQNYGYASEATVNPDGDRSLFQGGWYNDDVDQNAAATENMPFKNHPLKHAAAGTAADKFIAKGSTATSLAPVAFADSDTCRTCHNAGASAEEQVGVQIQSFPHFTPGYWKFMTAGSAQGAAMTELPAGLPAAVVTSAADITAAQTWLDTATNYEESLKTADGHCLKCHVKSDSTAGVGISY